MDSIFENFQYHGAWFNKTVITFNENNVEVDIQIDGYDEQEIPIKSREALESFLETKDNFTEAIAAKVFECYQREQNSIEFKNPIQLLNTLQLVGITVPDQDDFCEQVIYLVFNCDWDIEHGIGIRLVGGTVDEVGHQDIAL